MHKRSLPAPASPLTRKAPSQAADEPHRVHRDRPHGQDQRSVLVLRTRHAPPDGVTPYGSRASARDSRMSKIEVRFESWKRFFTAGARPTSLSFPP